MNAQTPILSKHVANKLTKQLNKKNGMKTLQHMMLLYSKSHRRKMMVISEFQHTDLEKNLRTKPIDDFYHLHPSHLQYKQLEKHLTRKRTRRA
jgi:hypothetical protein